VNLETVTTYNWNVIMSIIKKSLKIFSLTAILVSANIHATDITVGGSSVSVNDRADDGQGGWIYDIDKMDVKWSSDNTITVDVFTNFAYGDGKFNNYYSSGQNHKNIIFGDLLIGANRGSDTGFNYAFSLGDLNNSNSSRFDRSGLENETEGGLFAINSTESAGDYHGYNNDKGSVFGNTVGVEQNSGMSLWSAETERVKHENKYGDWRDYSWGKVSFSFNVGGIDAFKNATSLSLSWAMSCYNDAVHSTFDIARKNKPAEVPEPTTIVLMLFALAGIAYRQKNKRNSFSA